MGKEGGFLFKREAGVSETKSIFSRRSRNVGKLARYLRTKKTRWIIALDPRRVFFKRGRLVWPRSMHKHARARKRSHARVHTHARTHARAHIHEEGTTNTSVERTHEQALAVPSIVYSISV